MSTDDHVIDEQPAERRQAWETAPLPKAPAPHEPRRDLVEITIGEREWWAERGVTLNTCTILRDRYGDRQYLRHRYGRPG